MFIKIILNGNENKIMNHDNNQKKSRNALFRLNIANAILVVQNINQYLLNSLKHLSDNEIDIFEPNSKPPNFRRQIAQPNPHIIVNVLQMKNIYYK